MFVLVVSFKLSELVYETMYICWPEGGANVLAQIGNVSKCNISHVVKSFQF